MNVSAPPPPSIRCAVIRGGTTRGVFFHAQDLPTNVDERDRLLMAVIGGPDPRQVDGLGGADHLLSKVAVVWRSPRADTDVECLFGSITPGSPIIKYGTNCGNLAAAVARFAWDEGLVEASAEVVRIYNPDSHTRMEARRLTAEIDCVARLAEYSGMPPTGDLVELTFLDPAGTACGRLLPTGRVLDTLHIPDGPQIAATLIDAGALYVFVRAADLALPPDVRSGVVQGDPALMGMLEDLRGQAAVLAGLVATSAEALVKTPAAPKLAIIGAPLDYRTEGCLLPVAAREIDLLSRIISCQSFHKAYPVTGAIATTAAAATAGTVVHSLASGELHAGGRRLRIGHPTGVLECSIELRPAADGTAVARASILRTARRILEGSCFLERRR